MDFMSILPEDNILIVAPHPDDECIGAGGILVKYRQQCSVWVMTDGCIGQGNDKQQNLINIRRNEFVKEMEYLRIDKYKMFGIKDGTLIEHTNCLNNIDLSIFDKIFVTDKQDDHIDHMAAFQCVMNALKVQNLENNVKVFTYEVHCLIKQPSHMLVVSDYMDEMINLIRFHDSQISSMPYDRMIMASAEYRALQNRVKDGYVQCFNLIKVKSEITEQNNSLNELMLQLQKQKQFYRVLTMWLRKKTDGFSIASLIRKKGYKSVSIYGFAELGQILYKELLNENIYNIQVLDQKIKTVAEFEKLDIVKPEYGDRATDVVIVTAIFYMMEIKRNMQQLGYDNIVSMEELIE